MMNPVTLARIFALVLVLVLDAQARSQCPFTVTPASVGVTCSEVSPGSGVWDLSLSVTGTDAVPVTVIVGGDAPSIRDLDITITNPSGTGPQVVLRLHGSLANPAEPFNLSGLGSLTVNSTTGGELALLDVRVGGDVGEIEAHTIASMQVLGDITGGVTMLDPGGEGQGAAQITRLEVTGNILGDIGYVADGLRIDSLVVTGDIGTPANPAEVDAVAVGTVQCDEFFGEFAVSSELRRLVCTTRFVGDCSAGGLRPWDTGGGDPGIFINGGDFDGSIDIWGDLDGDLVVAGGLATGSEVRITGSLPSGRTISVGDDASGPITVGELAGTVTVGGDLTSLEVLADVTSTGSIDIGGLVLVPIDILGEMAGTITVERLGESIIFIGDGLVGDISIEAVDAFERSIVINANGSADPDRELWGGTVSVTTSGGVVVLDPNGTQPEKAPFYEVTTDTLIGTVGLAPFNFHPKDSIPIHGVSIITGAPTSVEIHHYGPVADSDGDTSTTPPVRVFEASLMVPVGKSHRGTPLCDSM